VRAFGEDPGIYLDNLAIPVPDPVDPRRWASTDSTLRAFVNWEVFFFADGTTKTAFEHDPLRWCGLLTDPVSEVRFHPLPGAAPVRHGGRPYYFASDSTRIAFMATPDSFAVRKRM
jgi:YHS domain-containing protein